MWPFSWIRNKLDANTLCLVFLIVIAFVIRVWLATEHNFLHEWDERYHALVAKNLLKHPFKPTLYDIPLFPYQINDWAFNHIWLSKPIIPLWIMALSLKIFGISELAVRIPSILFSTASVFITYLTGKELFGKRVGLAAGFLQAIHGLTLELSSGVFSSDHVDTIYLFWMQLGFWQILRYINNQKSGKSTQGNTVLIGVLSGLAFLSKWTAAIFLFLVWAPLLLLDKEKIRANILNMIIALFVFASIVVPWITYIYINYPEETRQIIAGIILPVHEVVQLHSGEWYFYLMKSHTIFGQVVFVPLLWLIWKLGKSRKLSESFNFLFTGIWIFIPLLLLSCLATKRVNYLLPIAPAYFILISAVANHLFFKTNKTGKIFFLSRLVAVLLFLLPIRYFIERSQLIANTEKNPDWAIRLKHLAANDTFYKKNVVLFNEPHAIEAMFYLDCVAYNWIPTAGQVKNLKEQGWTVLLLKNDEYLME